MSVADLGRVLVVIPTYNEAENIEPSSARLRASVPEADVLVVDDGSPDGTGEHRRRAGRRRPARARAAPDRQGRASAPPTSPGSAGRWRAGTTWWSRWTPTARTRPRSCPGCSTALRGRPTWSSAPAGCPAAQVAQLAAYRACSSRGGNLYSRLRAAAPGARHRPAATARSAGRCWRSSTSTRSPRRATASRSTWPGGPGGRASGSREVPITFTERERRPEQDEPGHRARGAVAGGGLGADLAQPQRQGRALAARR